MSTLNLWEFCKNGYFLDVRRIYFRRKKSKSSRQFSRINLSQSNFQGRCMGSWEVGKTHFPHAIFFQFFHFYDIMKLCMDRQATIPLPPCHTTAPYYRSHTKGVAQSRSYTASPPLTIPSPRLRSRRVWRSSLTRTRLRSSLCCFGYT